MPHAAVHLDDLDRVPLEESGAWRPVRRALGLTALGAHTYTAERAGDPLIEPHDELSAGAGGHEEVYVVMTGEASFTIDGEPVAAPAGTLVRVDVGTPRSAVAARPATTVLVVGGRPGAAGPLSPFEHWYAAQPAYEAGDYRRAIAIASEGLRDWPRSGGLNYQLACYLALVGDHAAAAKRLGIAFEEEPRARDWAREDADLDGVPRPA
jgi:hypothetical protein